MKLGSIIARLDQNFERILSAALDQAAQGLAQQVRTALSTPPGGPHDHPWRRSGELHDSIRAGSDGLTAVIASTSEIASFQEHGTATVPPRPTFAPLAAAGGEAIAHEIAHSLARALGAD